MKSKLQILNVVIGCIFISLNAWGQNFSLQDIIKQTTPLPNVTIYTAKEIVTMNRDKPKATAVAVVGNKILAVGSLDELKAAVGDQKYKVDNTFSDKVIIPGFIAQHDHPLLSSLAMILYKCHLTKRQ
jgi:adenine deaminase